MTYEQLLDEAVDLGIKVREKPLQGSDGRTKYDKVAIRQDMTTVRKTCVLAEELGHCLTTVGNILSQDSIDAVKQEHRARKWAYQKVVPVDRIIEAVGKGNVTLWDMAEYLDVDEEFLRDCLMHYGILDISL